MIARQPWHPVKHCTTTVDETPITEYAFSWSLAGMRQVVKTTPQRRQKNQAISVALSRGMALAATPEW
jgi:hypothetical protein